MPTSGDLKLEDCLFFTTPQNLNEPPLPPPKKIDPAPNRNDLEYYMMSLIHDVHTFKHTSHIWCILSYKYRSVPLKSCFLSSNDTDNHL